MTTNTTNTITDEPPVSVLSLLLILLSACIHASWNLASRKTKGDLAVLVGGICLACVIITPVAFLVPSYGPITTDAVIYVIASGLIHVAYMALVGAMYRVGDVSLVYPVARGTGVACTALLANPILGEVVSTVGGFGVASIIGGIVIMSLSKMDCFCTCVNKDLLNNNDVKKDEKKKQVVMSSLSSIVDVEETKTTVLPPLPPVNSKSKAPALALAVCCGMFISAYSLVDKVGVGEMNPIQFSFGMLLVECIFMVPYMFIYRREQCKKALKERKKYMVIVGVGGWGCYLIVLYVLTLSPSSYVTALREVSVCFGAALGVIVLKERLTVGMMLGVGCIVIGLVLIKMA